jgi:heptosyltransferase-1
VPVKQLRILIVRIGAMGDVLHALPAVAALRRRFPDAFIGWALEPRWADLLQIAGDPEDITQGVRWQVKALVDRWYSVPTKAWKRRPIALSTLREILAIRKVLRAEHFDHCIDLQGSIKSAVVGRFAEAPVFAGFAEPREEFARRLYNNLLPAIGTHVVEQNCNLLGAALGEELHPAPVTLPMQELAERWADDTVGSEPFCLISPGGGWGAKLWPAERFGQLAAQLGRLGMPSIVNASSHGSPEADEVAAASFDHARIVPCSIAQLIALVRRASIVIGGDTGPVHLAAALERPVVAIFGPTDPARNGPWNTRSRVLRDDSSVTSHKRKKEAEPGLLRISVEEVTAAALELLRPAPTPTPHL